MVVIGITPPSYAGFSPSEVIGFSPAERSADLQKVQKFLEIKMARERLKELGYTSEENSVPAGPVKRPAAPSAGSQGG
jgi:hypothetical protein